jgi:hypothetical protein
MKLLTSFSNLSMKALPILFFFLLAFTISNAADTTGRWVGTMEHKGTGSNTTVWYCDMDLTITGNRCKGTITYSFMQRNSPLALKVKFYGDVLDNTLVIQYLSRDIKKIGPDAKSILLQFRYKLLLVKNKFTNTVSGDYVGLSKGLIPDKTKGYIFLEPYKPEQEEVIVKKIDKRIDSLILVKDNPPPVPEVISQPLPTVKTETMAVKKTEQPATQNVNAAAKTIPAPPPVVIAPPTEEKKDTQLIVKTGPVNLIKDTIAAARPTELKLDTSSLFKAKVEVQTKLNARENIVTEKVSLDTGEVIVELYDNGEVDGDFVTVIHNKAIALSNAGLTEKALRFSFHIDRQNPFHEIVMYAENQGRVPPNTALMIITYGNQRKQVFLSADDKKSAVVLLELK